MARTHYDNLKISQEASRNDIRKAYKLLAQEWHPDKNTHRIEEAERNIKIINKAYRVLSDTTLRQRHDEWIGRHQKYSVGGRTYTGAHEDAEKTFNKYKDSQQARRRKRNQQRNQPFVISKKRFFHGIVALISMPLIAGILILSAETLSSFVRKVPSVAANLTNGISEEANIDPQIEAELYNFFAETNQTLTFITDSDSAIVALPQLENAMQYLTDIESKLRSGGNGSHSGLSNLVSAGLRGLKPKIIRLQSDSSIWTILYPVLEPIQRKLESLSD